jgi:tetratricopeptide (TPR) repeat protein
MLSYLKTFFVTPPPTAVEQKQAAEKCENNFDFNGAIEKYKIAAEMFENMEAIASFSVCLISAARLLVTLEKYKEAIELFERVALKTKYNSLLKWSNATHLFHASLCGLMLNSLEMDKYEEMILHTSFKNSRQGEFLTKLIGAIENTDYQLFTQVFKEYDLTTWEASILLKLESKLFS